MSETEMVENLCYVTKHAKIRVLDLLTIQDTGIIGDLLEAIHLHIKTLVYQPQEKRTTRFYNGLITVMKKAEDTNRAVLITAYMPNKELNRRGLKYGVVNYNNHEYSKTKE